MLSCRADGKEAVPIGGLAMPIEDLRATLERSYQDETWSRDGRISRQAWATASAVVREAGILKSDIKYDDIIDMSFVNG